MEISTKYIIAAIVVLIALFAVYFFKRKDKGSRKLTPLGGIGLALVIAGVLFGDSQYLSYGLFGAAIILGLVDLVIQKKKK